MTVARHRLYSFALALTFLLGAPAARAAAGAPKTLTRFHDPVIVQTAMLHGLTDRHTARYRLYRMHGGAMEPIPFQFDARDEDGELVFPAPTAGDEFSFDDNDEIVFMAKDTGGRVTREVLPAASDGALEIELTDPADGTRGWAYLVHFPDQPPPRSPARYATFDAKANEVNALFYRMTYFPGRNFFTDMRISPAGGGTGENLLTRMRVRMRPTLSLLLTSWSPEFTEESFAVTIDGVKNGPVRAVRRVRQSLDLGKFFPRAPSGTVYTYYYFSSFTTPSTFSIPWVVLKALRDFEFTGMDDFGPQALGMQYWDGANPEGLPFTGGTRPRVTDQDHDWWAVSGRAGTCLHAFVIPEQWRAWGIVRGTAFEDGARAADLERLPSEPAAHAAGYSLLHMTNLREPGAYEMNLAVIILPRPYQAGDEVQPLRMLTQPLRIQIGPVE